MRYSVFVDARREVGLGHFSRQLAFCQELVARNRQVRLYADRVPEVFAREVSALAAGGLLVYLQESISSETLENDVRVFDYRDFMVSHDSLGSQVSKSVDVIFDDYARIAPSNEYVLVTPNLIQPFDAEGVLVEAGSRLRGPKFLAIRKELFRTQAETAPTWIEEGPKILISSGGVFNSVLVSRLVAELHREFGPSIRVAAGDACVSASSEALRDLLPDGSADSCHVLQSDQFTSSMREADLCVLSPGVSVWEALAIRKRVLVICQNAEDAMLFSPPSGMAGFKIHLLENGLVGFMDEVRELLSTPSNLSFLDGPDEHGAKRLVRCVEDRVNGA